MDSVLQLLSGILAYILAVFVVIWNAMWFNTTVIAFVAAHPNAGLIPIGVAFVAGVSTLIGNSASLFVNRVRPVRFLAALLVNGLLLVASWLIWAMTLWVLYRTMLDSNVSLDASVRLILLGSAPLAFGFLILAPYVGPAIGIVLQVWSLCLVIGLAHFQTQQPILTLAGIVALGWIILFTIERTIGQPVLGMRNRLWARITGTEDQVTTEDLMIAYMRGNLMDDGDTGSNRP